MGVRGRGGSAGLAILSDEPSKAQGRAPSSAPDLGSFARRSSPPIRPCGGPPPRHISPLSRSTSPKSLCTSIRSTTRVRAKPLPMRVSTDGNTRTRSACGIPRYASATKGIWLFLEENFLCFFAERLLRRFVLSYSPATRIRASWSASSPSRATSPFPPPSRPKNAAPPLS